MGISRWEWAIVDFLILGFLVYELISVRRLIRKDKAKAATDPTRPPPD